MATGVLMTDHHEELDAKEDDFDDQSHKKLLNAVSQIYRKQRIAAPKRNEPFQQISEFNLTKSERKRKVGANDLLKALNRRAAHHHITQKIRSIQSKAKPLPKPLEKSQAEKLTRQAGYNTVKDELWNWEALIQRNRAADQLVFPLKDETVKFERDADFLSTFTKPSELELKMAEAMKKSLLCQEGKKDEEPDEKMTLKELFMRRNMVAKMRARESYRIAKAVRQNKIKSKKYHRVLKREKIKKELKEFELLQKTDPEAALAKLERVEKARAEERISLRHRNTGKWAKGVALRAKYDPEARAQLADNLKKSREITEKLKSSIATDSEDEDDEDLDLNEGGKSAGNPWVGENEVASFVSGYRKFWEEQKKQKEGVENKDKSTNVVSGGTAGSDEDESAAEPAVGSVVNGAVGAERRAEMGDVVKTSPHNNDKASGDTTINTPQEGSSNEGDSDDGTLKAEEDQSIVDKESSNEGNSGELPAVVEASSSTVEKADQTQNVFNCNTKGNESVSTPVTKRKKRKSKKATTCRDKSGTWSVVEIGDITEEGKSLVEVSKKNDDYKSGATEEKTVRNKSKRKSLNTSEGWSTELLNNADKKRKLEDMFDQAQMTIDDDIPNQIAEMKNKFRAKKSKVDEKTPRSWKSNPNDLSFKKSKVVELDESLIELAGDATGVSSGMSDVPKLVERLNSSITPKETKLPDIDPQKFIPVKRQKLNTTIPDFEEDGDSESDGENEKQHLNLMEAFADDDIADEFRKEKEEEEEDFKEKVIDLSLPGWGSWGGMGIVDRKKNRRAVKFPKVPRKDANKNTIIINEEPSAKFTKLMVNDLPQQMSNVAAYEAAIRAPIGDTWVAQSGHNALIAPQVITKMGAIIEPLDSSVLLRKEQDDKPLKVNGPLDKSPKKTVGAGKNSGKKGGAKHPKSGAPKKVNKNIAKKRSKRKS